MINVEAIQTEIDDGYINRQAHPVAPLSILNYSAKTQYEWRWNDETKACRGLIVDEDWNVIARPFPKFFSAEQLNYQVPAEPFQAFEKLDGSLGILYFVDGEPRIATRGSFTSPQAIRATEILHSHYGFVRLNPDLTYLFEIIYPENRIVIDYGRVEELVLLAIIETQTGRELPLHEIGFPLAKRYLGIQDFDELMTQQDDSREGFVVLFESGTRVKIKFDEYKRLHKLLTGVSPKTIWEVLSSGGDLSPVIERVPDEFHQWVRETENDLRERFCKIELSARENMRFGGSRKELASRFNNCQHPDVMFAMLDGKDYADMIWRKIKPDGSPMFKCESIRLAE